MTAPGYRLDEAALEAAYKAYLDCPIDMCGDHDEECEKTVRAAIVAYLAAAPQPEPPVSGGDQSGLKSPQIHAQQGVDGGDQLMQEMHKLPEPPADLVERAWDHMKKASKNGWLFTQSSHVAEAFAAFAQEHAVAEKARADRAEKALWDAEINLDPEHETRWYAAYKDLLADIRARAALNGE
ncbi:MULTISPECIES: hypothetical protein [unclassified Chelatococcus]|uniref:hypothetical protein n=1 Tax=unclassified Chelatococcus TaxID=2638111 RepID=UPI001BCF6D8E|nr:MULTISPECIES: hypothetical protein [unclassified Chelatococcus]CAH1665446.1 hypothetical protein CHELA41_22665 [Hyphomicrobiales bacterium]MBS7737722.1 hypothetical protein [Chelatococcus sp. HY11]MBX3544144.1 hypothetical protein [Chelatococcus sp.]MCO5079185.1 hypothetical protein [Chelatococcus sp.]CAH1678363.1 hypothetical protein CHELA41_24524 [Hyphomicrobiales bacterium]